MITRPGAPAKTAVAAAWILAAIAGIMAGVSFAALPAFATESASGKKDPARAITSQLICPCSCGEILSGCTCETGKAMQGYVDRELKSGRSKGQIEAALVNQYGEVILGAPKAKGFNLLVWVAPFLATAFGLLLTSFILFRWVRHRAAAVGDAPGAGEGPNQGAATTAEQDLESLRARAEAELKRLRE